MFLGWLGVNESVVEGDDDGEMFVDGVVVM